MTEPLAEQAERAENGPTNDLSQLDKIRETRFKRKEVIAEGFKNKTKGEAVFNGLSYVGVGYFGVTATSVAMTWLLRDTKKIAPVFEKYVTSRVKKIGINPSFANIATLFMGGTLATVLPVKWLEDRKPQIVRQLDNILYSDQELANNPKIEAAHHELDIMPKQTWVSLVSSRVVAFAATLGVFLLMGANDSPVAKLFGKAGRQSLDEKSIKFGRWMDRTLHSGNRVVSDQIDAAIAENKWRMQRLREGQKKRLDGMEVIRDAKDTSGNVVKGDRIASRVWSYIGLDAIYTLVTSACLWPFTRIFGGIFGKPSPTTSTTMPEPSTPNLDTAQAIVQAGPAPGTNRPGTQVQTPSHLERVANTSRTAELTS